MAGGNANGGSSLPDPLIGAVFGQYKITEFVEQGGWGNVYKATDLKFEKDVAIKIIHQHVLKEENNIKRFRREARLLCRLESRHVIKVLDAGTTPAPYIVMEYFAGIPLDDWLSVNGPMKAPMAIDLFYQLCRALAEAQALNIVHRDLRPANVLIKTDGETVEAKIVDFGFAKCLTPDSTFGGKITEPGEMMGSPPYMSPEHFKGNSDHRSDIYSLGCIMYEVLAGCSPFKAKFAPDYFLMHQSTTPERISKARPGSVLPAKLEAAIFTCLQKSPNRRYQSAESCAQDLQSIKDDLKP